MPKKQDHRQKIGVLTSGGDAQGMNAALRSIVRTSIANGIEVYAIYEGYQGLVKGGDRFKKMSWRDVGGILQVGGTIIGTARCKDFRTFEGRLKAAKNLVEHGISNLIVIGGDGSLTGANIFREEWKQLLETLVRKGQVDENALEKFPDLQITGLVGSIDNDMYGTDMTIGADTALHRIIEAIDAIKSTADSHQRTFVVEVMGRNCGYLALMSAMASGADWVFIPESPPDVDNWQDIMVKHLAAGREGGRRHTIVIVAEGARDRNGNSITSQEVADILAEWAGEDVRITVLGHVQRGGTPSVFDRNLGTRLGNAAVQTIIQSTSESEPLLIGLHGNKIHKTPLMECVKQSRTANQAMKEHDYDLALTLRGNSFVEAFNTLRIILRAKPHIYKNQNNYNLAILHAGAPAPGMNAAVRAAVRIGMDKGHKIFGIRHGFTGFAKGKITEFQWMDVNGWASKGGAELGTSPHIPDGSDLYEIAKNIEKYNIHGLLIIGGWAGYESAYKLINARKNFPAFDIPIICLPASIDNNLPGSDISIGADTALNNIIDAVDKIKDSAVALNRCFVVEVMGGDCGYLALMSGLATGAEKVYINEDGITIKDLEHDVEYLNKGFRSGKRLGLIIRNENANKIYTTAFVCALFEEEGKDLYDVRQSILGYLQQGGAPSPFDRTQATKLATRSILKLIELVEDRSSESSFIGLEGTALKFHYLEDFQRMVDMKHKRPKKEWWLEIKPVSELLAQPIT